MTHVNDYYVPEDYYTPDDWNYQELLVRSAFSFFNTGVAPLPNKTGYISGNMYQPVFQVYTKHIAVVPKDSSCIWSTDNTPRERRAAERRRWWSMTTDREYFRLFWCHRLVYMRLILHKSKGELYGKKRSK